jgi:hypothetical protein
MFTSSAATTRESLCVWKRDQTSVNYLSKEEEGEEKWREEREETRKVTGRESARREEGEEGKEWGGMNRN